MNKKWIAIARVGNFADSAGRPQNFSKERLSNIASSYKPERHEAPLVLGHPLTDSPAHGWVKELKFSGEKLMASVDGLTPELQKNVDNGHYKYVSMSLFEGDRLKHIGLLGALAPAIDGLGPVALNAASESVINFSFENIDENIKTKEHKKMDETLLRELQSQIEALKNQLAEMGKKLSEAEAEAAGKGAEAEKSAAENAKTAAEFAAFKNEKAIENIKNRIEGFVAAGKLTPAEKTGVTKTAEALHSLEAHQNFSAASGQPGPLEEFLQSFETKPNSGIFQNFSAPAADAPAQKSVVSKL